MMQAAGANVFNRKILAWAFAAGLLNIAPRLFSPPAGDIFVHYALIECFSRQLWEGNLYPRWCIEANAGLGGSDFLFYFPFPYYFTALFYPLHYLGMTIDQMYVASLFCVGIVTFMTCWIWLSDIVDHRYALMASFLFLWLPYRSELLYWRSAYPELWVIALLPLLWLLLRRLVSRRSDDWLSVAAIIGLCMFTHVPVTLDAIAAGGFYCIALAPEWRTVFRFSGAVVLAGMLSSIYVLPARYFLFLR